MALVRTQKTHTPPIPIHWGRSGAILSDGFRRRTISYEIFCRAKMNLPFQWYGILVDRYRFWGRLQAERLRSIFFPIIFLLFFGPATVHEAFGQGGGLMDLNVYRWKNRLLMVFSPYPEDSDYQAFMKEVQNERNGLRDRDILVFEIFEKEQSRLGNSPLKKDSADFLRERFSVQQGSFLVILIGKDGEEKIRWQKVNLTEIFAVIDGMPMRQREMRERNKKQR
jgi:hypothetical protein